MTNTTNFASSILLQNEPESTITHRRKTGRFNVIDVNEGKRDLEHAMFIINNWKEQKRGLYLAVLLRGQAQNVLGNFPYAQKHDCALIVNALKKRYAPSNQNDLYRNQLRERKQRTAETLPELGQSIRRLTNQAYPTAPGDFRVMFAKEQLIDVLTYSV